MMRTLKTLLLVAGLCALTGTASEAQVNIAITAAPPLLPVYEQPPCPEDGYLWTPGYWAYGDYDYYWVPGVWVAPPRIGFLWTPGYWGFNDGLYLFHPGYWGPRVGFYGGVNYGYGYNGYGYAGGAWRGNRFLYNTAVTRVNVNAVRNVYVDRAAVRERGGSRASFNGPGGVSVRPTAEQRQIAGAPHLQPTREQLAHRQAARGDRGASAAVSRSRPAATAEPVRGQGFNEGAGQQAGRAANGVYDGRVERGEGGFAGRPANVERRANTERLATGGNGLTPEEQRLAARRGSRVNPDAGRERQADAQAQRHQAASAAGRRVEAQQMQGEAAARRGQGEQRQAQGQPHGQHERGHQKDPQEHQ